MNYEKKSIYVLAVAMVIATLVISSTSSTLILRNASISDNDDYDTGASDAPKNDDSSVQRLKSDYSQIIDIDTSDNTNINPSKINKSVFTSMEIATGNIPYNENRTFSEKIT